MEPLVIAFVWNREDEPEVNDCIEYAYSLLSRDTNMPYSRTIDLPVFFYHNIEDGAVPPSIMLETERIIIYVFIGTNSVAADGWDTYIKDLYKVNNARVVPVALDRYAMNIDKSIGENNFIRLYDFKHCKKQELFISMAHEIYRCGFFDRDVSMNSENSALKIFLSHTKEPKKEAKSNNPDKDGIEEKKDGDGLVLAKQLKGLIDETSMNRFFDASDIAPAYRFDDEIRRNIGEASVVVINSDVYASRYWCQREIQQAKRDGRPVVEVDIISSGMDRKLPYAGNIPLVRIDMEEGQAKEEDLLRVLEAILIETVRFNHVSQKLENEQKAIDGDVKIICRPPEMMDLENMIERSEDGGLSIQCNKIMYPDPPIYSEETEFFEKNGIKVFTPIEAPYDGKFLNGKNIGISVSDVVECPVCRAKSKDRLDPERFMQLKMPYQYHVSQEEYQLIKKSTENNGIYQIKMPCGHTVSVKRSGHYYRWWTVSNNVPTGPENKFLEKIDFLDFV